MKKINCVFLLLLLTIPNISMAKETRKSCSTITDQIYKNKKNYKITNNNKVLYDKKNECRKLGFSTTRMSKSKSGSTSSRGNSESERSCATLSSQIYKATNKKTKKSLYKRTDKCKKLGFSTTTKGWNN